MPTKTLKPFLCPPISRNRDAGIGGGADVEDPRIGLEDEPIRFKAIPVDHTRRQQARRSKLTGKEDQEHKNLDLEGLFVELDGIVQSFRKT